MIINDKQEAFCQEYCSNGFNASAAYKIAYPKAKAGHRQNGQRLITKDYIKERIVSIKVRIELFRTNTREKVTKHFLTLAKACEENNDRVNLCRCLENLGKNVGWYAEDNAQQAEQSTLDAEQQAQLERYKLWCRAQMLKGA